MKIKSPLTGLLVLMSEVKDPVFSQKMMGDGFAIVPSANEVVSPVDATIEVLYPTGHAIGLRTEDGIEILIHLGIDTVKSKSNSFKLLKQVGDVVKAGDPIIQMNLKQLLKEGYDMTTPIVFLSGQKLKALESKNINLLDDLEIEFV
ncbi:MAG: PTS glucose transporter subunit IIA [Erysipelotrichaceae bacterium]|nr:PTS glucose transporter subunit IIA [Erysipelotrichaceae bacterium]